MQAIALSIRAKLTFISVIASCLVLSVFALAIYFYEIKVAFEEKETTLMSQSEIISKNIGESLASGDFNEIKKLVSIYQSDPDFLLLQILDNSGKIVFSIPQSVTAQKFSSNSFTFAERSRFRENSFLDLRTNIVFKDQVIGLLLVRSSYTSVQNKLAGLNYALIMALTIAVLLSILMKSRLQGIVTHRLLKLLAVIQEISFSRDFSTKIPDLGNDEIGILGNSFSEMLTEINKRDLSLRLSNLSLEGRIQERTMELEKAVEKLISAQSAISLKHRQLQAIIAGAPIAMAMLNVELVLIVGSLKWMGEYIPKTVGTTFSSLLESPNLPPSWNNAFAQALEGETISNAEDNYTLENGTTIYLRWTIQPWWKSDGDVGGVIVASENISDLVQARNSAIKSAEAKSQFVANISHELRTPLNGIIGFSSILETTECSVEQRECVELIKSSGQTLLRVINDILEFSKLERKSTQIENLVFSPSNLIQELGKLFSPSGKEKGIALKIEIDPSTPSRTIGDEFRIKQILTNLLGNAFKFTSQGSINLKLKVKAVENQWVNLVFSVQDSGIGVSSDKLELIFKPFCQADGSVTRRFGGTGLGLTIAADLANLMGGKLQVKSTPNQGSEFFFELKLLIDQVSHSPRREDFVASKRLLPSVAKRILIAEDNVINQRLISLILAKAGYHIEVVEDGLMAIAAFEKGGFDMIILDLQMPKMGGIEAALEIRKLKQAGGDKIPLVALTAATLAEDQSKCKSAGMNSFLTKPLDKTALLNAISDLLQTS